MRVKCFREGFRVSATAYYHYAIKDADPIPAMLALVSFIDSVQPCCSEADISPPLATVKFR